MDRSTSQYYPLMDYCKLVMACLVVALHFPPLATYSTLLNCGIVLVVGRIPVPFFFIASGFLFFKRVQYSSANADRIKNFILRFLVLYGVWEFVLMDSPRPQMWYIKASVISSLILYLCCLGNISSNKVFVASVLFYVLGLMRNTYYHALEPLFGNTFFWEIFNSRFADFVIGIGRNGLCEGLFYMTIGLKLAEVDKNLMKRGGIVIALALSLLCLTVEAYLVESADLSREAVDNYIFLTPVCIFLFLMVISYTTTHSTVSKPYRIISELIFFLHCGVNDILRYYLFEKYHIEDSLLIYSVTLVFTLLLAWAIYRFSLTSRGSILRLLY